VQLLAGEGVGVKQEPNGKIFPASDRALDVQQALIRRLERSGCRVVNQCRVTAVEPGDDGFRVVAEATEFRGRRLIVTTGGMSYPGCGTTGDGYQWMAKLGHTIIPPHPALVPLRSNAVWLPPLAGISLQDTQVSVVQAEPLPPDHDPLGRLGYVRKRHLIQRRAPLLFTHLGLSGPAPMDVSKAFATAADPLTLRCVVDLLPQTEFGELDARVDQTCHQFGRRQVSRICQQVLSDTEVPLRLIETLLELADVPPTKPAAELSKAERGRFLAHLKSLAVPITDTLGFNKAEVTTGGVRLTEVHSQTMESKKVPGLFLAGELLDLDGWIGGYNFTAAFATGWLAGQTAAES
jgi:predicted Rossmann fold flavoprotein